MKKATPKSFTMVTRHSGKAPKKVVEPELSSASKRIMKAKAHPAPVKKSGGARQHKERYYK